MALRPDVPGRRSRSITMPQRHLRPSRRRPWCAAAIASRRRGSHPRELTHRTSALALPVRSRFPLLHRPRFILRCRVVRRGRAAGGYCGQYQDVRPQCVARRWVRHQHGCIKCAYSPYGLQEPGPGPMQYLSKRFKTMVLVCHAGAACQVVAYRYNLGRSAASTSPPA